jgi:hypothetical protein
MKKLITIAVLGAALTFGGCQQFKDFESTVSNAVEVVAGAKVNSQTAYIAINVFNGLESGATEYLKLPACGTGPAICRTRGAAAKIGPPFNAGISARNNLRAWMKANPGATVADAGLYNTLVSATNALKDVMAAYGVTAN